MYIQSLSKLGNKLRLVSEAIAQLFRDVATTILNFVLPEFVRRVLFTASLYSHIAGVDPNTADEKRVGQLLREINALLNIVQNGEQALKIPFLLHKQIWGKMEVMTDATVRAANVEVTVGHILSITPKWLRYNPGIMYEDAKTIFQRFHEMGIKSNDMGNLVAH